MSLLVIVSTNVFSQSAVKGNLTDAISGKTIEFATVSVMRAGDSVIAGGNISDSLGNFMVDALTPGDYIIRISFLGYADHASDVITLGDGVTDMGIIALKPSDNALETVVVTGTKSVVETIPGGIVYNADQVLTNENGTVLDMMKGVPNVIVDKDEHISIRGNSGITVMMDGVPLNMSGDDLTNFLKQLPSNMISAVEVITTPGAKYDAAGSAGIINLRSKQNKTTGTNGSINAGAGTLGSYNAGASLFSNQSKVRMNASYNFSHNVFEGGATGYKENYLNPDPLFIYDEAFTQEGSANDHFVKAGIEYTPDAKNSIGGSVSYGNDVGSFGLDDNLYTKDVSGIPSGSYHALLQYNYTGDNYGANLHYLNKISDKGHEISADANYSHYTHDNNVPSSAEYFTADGSIIPGMSTSRLDSTDFGVDIYTGKLDYVLPFKNAAKFEAGLKHTFTATENNLHAIMQDMVSGEWINDTSVSNNFSYTENVSAAYASFAGTLKKISYTLGLRSELTSIHTESTTVDAAYDRNYLDFFPSGNLKYTLNKGGELGLDYSRRIERPIYQWLNPFVDKSTPYTWFTGNPELKPYYTNSLTLNYSKFIQMKHYVVASLFYQSMQDIFTQYFEYADAGVYYMTIKNINNQTNYGASLMVQSATAKWLDITLNASAYENSIDNELSSVAPDTKLSFTTYLSGTFKFWKNTSFQLTGNYMSPSTNPQGYFKGFYTVDAGLKKTFVHDKLAVNVNVKDIFNSMEFSNEFIDDSFYADYTFKPVSRIASIAITWKFGDAMQNLMPDQKTEEDRRVNFGGRNG